MQHLTMEDFERALATPLPPKTPEEIKALEDSARKMQNLSREELQEYLDPSED